MNVPDDVAAAVVNVQDEVPGTTPSRPTRRPVGEKSFLPQASSGLCRKALARKAPALTAEKAHRGTGPVGFFVYAYNECEVSLWVYVFAKVLRLLPV